MYLWLWLTLLSGILLGFYDILKKKALERVPLLNVLALYTLFCFIMVSYEFRNAMSIDLDMLLLILVKSLVIFVGWALAFMSIQKLPISIITPFGILSPLFSIVFGVLVLKEKLAYFQIIGIVIILISYYFIGKAGAGEVEGLFRNKYLYLMILSMLLNATSALIDKIALKRVNIGQMQFWFCLFLTLLYFAALFVSRLKESNRGPIKFSFYILFMSVLLVVADRVYFYAVKMPSSQISIIMPLKSSSIFVSAILGGIIFKEKNIGRKVACIFLLMLGVVVLFMG